MIQIRQTLICVIILIISLLALMRQLHVTKNICPLIMQLKSMTLKKYGRLNALDGISFDVCPNEVFGFLGPNGAGKTTTIKCITTLTKPCSGSIEIFGINALSHPDQVRTNIGYVPQNLSLIGELSGYETISSFHLYFYWDINDLGKRLRTT
jgi:ABC-2 type transport system ATP-binding protein